MADVRTQQTSVPAGVCVTHGQHGMTSCPSCSTAMAPTYERITDYGFTFGPMIVERVCSDDRVGYVLVVRDSDRNTVIEIRCSPKGRSWDVGVKDYSGDLTLVWGKP